MGYHKCFLENLYGKYIFTFPRFKLIILLLHQKNYVGFLGIIVSGFTWYV